MDNIMYWADRRLQLLNKKLQEIREIDPNFDIDLNMTWKQYEDIAVVYFANLRIERASPKDKLDPGRALMLSVDVEKIEKATEKYGATKLSNMLSNFEKWVIFKEEMKYAKKSPIRDLYGETKIVDVMFLKAAINTALLFIAAGRDMNDFVEVINMNPTDSDYRFNTHLNRNSVNILEINEMKKRVGTYPKRTFNRDMAFLDTHSPSGMSKYTFP